MEQKRITEEAIQAFRQYLIRGEKSAVTVEKYLRDIRAFQAFIGETPVEKELVIHYKNHLLEESYAVRFINSMLASVNSFLIFMDWPDCKVKSLKVQRQVYCAEEKELTKAEYERLLKAAGKNEQLRLVMETICSTGIRVSELKFFTAEAVRRGEVIVRCKAKDPDDPASRQAETAAAGLCRKTENPLRRDLSHGARKTSGSESHMGADERAVQSRRGKAGQGLSP